MIENPSPLPEPHDSCAQIMRAVRSSGLTWGTQETLCSMFLTIQKRFLKNAKISPNTARPPTHTPGVDKGNQQYEQLLATNRECQLTIPNLESGVERLKNDLEGEVNNSGKLNNTISVSKALVNNLNKRYAEADEQVNHSAKTFANLDKTSKARKKAKEEVARLTNKNEESQKNITELRETLRFSFS
jgi:DNA repair ATPase RecN